jgi:hypothetical protein
MTEEGLLQRELIAALHLEDAFDSAQLGFPKREQAAVLKPTLEEMEDRIQTRLRAGD